MFARGVTRAIERLIVTAGKRIQGDFSNALVSSRMLFQSFTTDGGTAVGAVPNGKGLYSAFAAYASSNADQSAFVQLAAAPTEVSVGSWRTGAASYLPLAFYAGGALRFQLDPSSNRFKADFSNASVNARLCLQTTATNGVTNVSALPNGTATGAALVAHNSSDGDNSSYLYIAAGSADVSIGSSKAGSASYLPMSFYTNGAIRHQIALTGDTTAFQTSASVFSAHHTVFTDASGSKQRAVARTVQNENSYTVSSINQYINTDGSSTIAFTGTRAGARNSYREVTDWTIDSNGILLNTSQSQLMTNARASAAQISGLVLLAANVDRQQGGANYNAGTGVYTAQVTGIYAVSFSATIYNGTGSAATQGMGISATGYTAQMAAQTIQNASYACFTQTRIVYLAAGSTVQVLMTAGLSATLYAASAVIDVALLQ